MGDCIRNNPILPSKYISKHQREFICGYIAGFINIAVTFPLNKIMFRQMLHGVSTGSAIRQLKKEGMNYLYRGCLPPLCQKTLTVSLMFGTYSTYTDLLKSRVSFSSGSLPLITAALLAGSTEAILTPLERVQILLQDQKFHKKFKNTFHVFFELRKYGVKEYYRGLSAVLLRNGPSTVLFFSVRDSLKSYLPKTDSFIGCLVEDFITGSVVGALISTIFYPVNVAKTKMQNRYGTRYVSFNEAMYMTYMERDCSIRKIFYGVHINYTRSFLSWGIINASYEFLKRFLFPESASIS